MGETTLPTKGGCMCGAVRYETAGEAMGVYHYHCQSCRKHNGAPVATLAVFEVDQVKFGGDERRICESAPSAGRAFCAKCGTPLIWGTGSGDLGRLCAIHISTFDNPDTVTPTAHSFYSERISWFDIADDLPRYEGFVADGSLLRHGPAKEEPSG